MALHVFDSTQTSQYSEGGTTFSNPITIIKNGSIGTTQTLLLYLNNDNGTYTYENVTIQPTPDSKIGESSLTGWKMKVLPGLNGIPTEDEWDSVLAGNVLYYTDDAAIPYTGSANIFPDEVTYFYPFYLRIIIPAGTPVQQTRAIKLAVNGTQV